MLNWFEKRKKSSVHVDKSMIQALKEYVDSRQETERQKREATDDHVRFSLGEPAFDDSGVLDMKQFVKAARKDTAMFDTPAFSKSYHQWERKTATRNTFSSRVMKILEEKQIKPAAFYKAANLDKRVFHTMKKDYLYVPSKQTALRCCFGLRLKYEEAAELLQLAGYSFSPSNSRELALRFCLENEVYDLYSVNYMLEALGETAIS